ncbi:Uncharacterised protein [Mycobacteroides abscessus subsp. abscessus]|nr:Uncharacterised protein [Mycobacteroides abscessus subsp. abscessus]
MAAGGVAAGGIPCISAQSSGTRKPIAPVAESSASGMSGDNAS